MYSFALDELNFKGSLVVVIIDFMGKTKQYQGDFKNEINDQNTEDSTFRSRAIDHTDWAH